MNLPVDLPLFISSYTASAANMPLFITLCVLLHLCHIQETGRVSDQTTTRERQLRNRLQPYMDDPYVNRVNDIGWTKN